jgi:hypothetical protein
VSPGRERRRQGPRGTAHPQPGASMTRPALRRRTPRRTRVILVAVLVGGALGLWALVRQWTAPPPAPSLSTDAMSESTLVANNRGDWESVLRWTRLMAAIEPSNSKLTLCLGLAWHNYSYVGPRSGRNRLAIRTSLERIEMESRALAFIDSAAAGMPRNEEWAQAMTLAGTVCETLGLPLEARQYYLEVRRQLPRSVSVLPRALFVEESLRDPGTIPSGLRAVRIP